MTEANARDFLVRDYNIQTRADDTKQQQQQFAVCMINSRTCSAQTNSAHIPLKRTKYARGSSNFRGLYILLLPPSSGTTLARDKYSREHA